MAMDYLDRIQRFPPHDLEKRVAEMKKIIEEIEGVAADRWGERW